MFIKTLRRGVFDVFIGNGWTQWARVARNGRDIKQIDGTFELNERTLDNVKRRIIK